MRKRLKKFLVRVLIKRGTSKLEEWLGKSIRNGLMAVGGAFAGAGVADADTVATIVAGGMALLGATISYARVHLQEWAVRIDQA
jgi:hypothetical protein